MSNRKTGLLLLQIPGWLLLCYLIVAQAIPAFDYELGVRMGTQESAARVTEVGSAFWYGFAFGDLVVYIPLLAGGLIGIWRGVGWAHNVMAAALGITVYWPVVCLAAVVDARGAPGWQLENESQFWIALPLIAVWAVWGLVWLAGSRSGGSGRDT